MFIRLGGPQTNTVNFVRPSLARPRWTEERDTVHRFRRKRSNWAYVLPCFMPLVLCLQYTLSRRLLLADSIYAAFCSHEMKEKRHRIGSRPAPRTAASVWSWNVHASDSDAGGGRPA